jgi:hypothetical protein
MVGLGSRDVMVFQSNNQRKTDTVVSINDSEAIEHLYQYGNYFVATRCEQTSYSGGNDYEFESNIIIAKIDDDVIPLCDSFDKIYDFRLEKRGKFFFDEHFYDLNTYQNKLVKAKHHAKRADYFEKGLNHTKIYWRLRGAIRDYEFWNKPLLLWNKTNFAHFRLTID